MGSSPSTVPSPDNVINKVNGATVNVPVNGGGILRNPYTKPIGVYVSNDKPPLPGNITGPPNTGPVFNNSAPGPVFNLSSAIPDITKPIAIPEVLTPGITPLDQENFTNKIKDQVAAELENKLGRDPLKYKRVIVARKFKIVPYDEDCKEGYYDATWEVVNNNFDQVKCAFHDSDFFLARVMNGSVDGPGYGFNTRTFDERNIAARLIYKPKGVHYENQPECKPCVKKKKCKKGVYEEKHKYTGCEGAHATVKTTWEPFMTQKYHQTSTDMPYHMGNVCNPSPCGGLQPSYYSTPYINPGFVSPNQSYGNLNMPCNTIAPSYVQPGFNTSYVQSGFNTMYQSRPMTDTKPMFFNTPSTHVPMRSTGYGSFY